MDGGSSPYHRRMAELTLKATLSPSRISDFKSCPLKFRFRNIDRLPERPSAEAFRGTVVHKVLEDLFDLPRDSRTPDFAKGDLPRAFAAEFEKDPLARFAVDPALAWPDDGAEASDASVTEFIAALPAFIERYFVVERPETFDPTHREHYLRGQLDEDLWLHGYVDRIDIAPTGDVRIVDYKTGRSPGPKFQEKALFQLKCYAALWTRTHDVHVRRLMMLFLGDGERLTVDPSAKDIAQAEQQVREVWDEIKQANARADWRPQPSKLCDWCSHQQRCDAKGGTTPALAPVPLEFPS